MHSGKRRERESGERGAVEKDTWYIDIVLHHYMRFFYGVSLCF